MASILEAAARYHVPPSTAKLMPSLSACIALADHTQMSATQNAHPHRLAMVRNNPDYS